MTEYRNADQALIGILKNLLETGNTVSSRQGEKTTELIHQSFTLTHPLEREILNPFRKASLPAQIAETMWVLAGRNDVEWLSTYLPRAAEFSDDGKVWRAGYGPRLRTWDAPGQGQHNVVDQVQQVIDLLQGDPETRRAVISLWDPEQDWTNSKDIPCNNWLHFLARDGELHLSVAIRSNDVVWGWSGINQFEWSVLLEIIASIVGLDVGRITYLVGSQHVYEKHVGRAAQIISWDPEALIERGIYRSPRFNSGDRSWQYVAGSLIPEWFDLEYLIRTGQPIDAWMSRVDAFPEPMMRSWLYVLAAYWDRRTAHMQPYVGTRLWHAWDRSVKKHAVQQAVEPAVEPAGPQFSSELAPFYTKVVELHKEKHAAYGDSWRKRGELLGIMANVARKVDRLGGSETADETTLDTAIDLMNYLIKYQGWTENFGGREELDDFALRLAAQLSAVTLCMPGWGTLLKSSYESRVKELFELLCAQVIADEARNDTISRILNLATGYAVNQWNAVESHREGLELAAAWRPDKP